LAREIARLHGSSVETDWLARVLDTPRQAGLDAPSRRRNVVGAFAVAPRREPVASRVWLVDDVTTTGATLGSAAEALRRAGVREVMGICLARTPDAQSV
jgi:predicted amidophosphoribosyltransferase